MPSCELPGCRSKQRAQVREDGRKLCDRCFQKEIEASENVTNDEVEDEDRPASDVPRLVINELLMYCDNHVKNSSRDAIKRVVIRSWLTLVLATLINLATSLNLATGRT